MNCRVIYANLSSFITTLGHSATAIRTKTKSFSRHLICACSRYTA